MQQQQQPQDLSSFDRADLANDPIFNKLSRYIPVALEDVDPSNPSSRWENLLKMLRDPADPKKLYGNIESLFWKICIILTHSTSKLDINRHSALIELLLTFDCRGRVETIKTWLQLLISLSSSSISWVNLILTSLCQVLCGKLSLALYKAQLIQTMSCSSDSSLYDDLKTELATDPTALMPTSFIGGNNTNSTNNTSIKNGGGFVTSLDQLHQLIQQALTQILLYVPMCSRHMISAFVSSGPHYTAPLYQQCLWVSTLLRACELHPILRDSLLTAILEKLLLLDVHTSRAVTNTFESLQQEYVSNALKHSLIVPSTVATSMQLLQQLEKLAQNDLLVSTFINIPSNSLTTASGSLENTQMGDFDSNSNNNNTSSTLDKLSLAPNTDTNSTTTANNTNRRHRRSTRVFKQAEFVVEAHPSTYIIINGAMVQGDPALLTSLPNTSATTMTSPDEGESVRLKAILAQSEQLRLIDGLMSILSAYIWLVSTTPDRSDQQYNDPLNQYNVAGSVRSSPQFGAKREVDLKGEVFTTLSTKSEKMEDFNSISTKNPKNEQFSTLSTTKSEQSTSVSRSTVPEIKAEMGDNNTTHNNNDNYMKDGENGNISMQNGQNGENCTNGSTTPGGTTLQMPLLLEFPPLPGLASKKQQPLTKEQLAGLTRAERDIISIMENTGGKRRKKNPDDKTPLDGPQIPPNTLPNPLAQPVLHHSTSSIEKDRERSQHDQEMSFELSTALSETRHLNQNLNENSSNSGQNTPFNELDSNPNSPLTGAMLLEGTLFDDRAAMLNCNQQTTKASKLNDDVFGSFFRAFNRSVLPTNGPHFTQWLLFVQCSFRIEYMEVLLRLLNDRLFSPRSSNSIRTACVLYTGSLLVRAKFIRATSAASALNSLAQYAHQYIDNFLQQYIAANVGGAGNQGSSGQNGSVMGVDSYTNSTQSSLSPENHTVFFVLIETLIYVVTLRPDLVKHVRPVQLVVESGQNKNNNDNNNDDKHQQNQPPANSIASSYISSHSSKIQSRRSVITMGNEGKDHTNKAQKGALKIMNNSHTLSPFQSASNSPIQRSPHSHSISVPGQGPGGHNSNSNGNNHDRRDKKPDFNTLNELHGELSPLLSPLLSGSAAVAIPSLSINGNSGNSLSVLGRGLLNSSSNTLQSRHLTQSTLSGSAMAAFKAIQSDIITKHAKPIVINSKYIQLSSNSHDPLHLIWLLTSLLRPSQYLSPLLLERYLLLYHNTVSLALLYDLNNVINAQAFTAPSTNSFNNPSSSSHHASSASILGHSYGHSNNTKGIKDLESALAQLGQFSSRSPPLFLPAIYIPSLQQSINLSSFISSHSTSITQTTQLLSKLSKEQRIVVSTFIKQQLQAFRATQINSMPSTLSLSSSLSSSFTQKNHKFNNLFDTTPLSPSNPLITLTDLQQVGIYPVLHHHSPLNQYSRRDASPPKQSGPKKSALTAKAGAPLNNLAVPKTIAEQDAERESYRDHLIAEDYLNGLTTLQTSLSFLNFPFDPFFLPTVRDCIPHRYVMTFDNYQSQARFYDLYKNNLRLKFNFDALSTNNSTQSPPRVATMSPVFAALHGSRNMPGGLFNNGNGNSNEDNATVKNDTLPYIKLGDVPTTSAFVTSLHKHRTSTAQPQQQHHKGVSMLGGNNNNNQGQHSFLPPTNSPLISPTLKPHGSMGSSAGFVPLPLFAGASGSPSLVGISLDGSLQGQSSLPPLGAMSALSTMKAMSNNNNTNTATSLSLNHVNANNKDKNKKALDGKKITSLPTATPLHNSTQSKSSLLTDDMSLDLSLGGLDSTFDTYDMYGGQAINANALADKRKRRRHGGRDSMAMEGLPPLPIASVGPTGSPRHTSMGFTQGGNFLTNHTPSSNVTNTSLVKSSSGHRQSINTSAGQNLHQGNRQSIANTPQSVQKSKNATQQQQQLQRLKSTTSKADKTSTNNSASSQQSRPTTANTAAALPRQSIINISNQIGNDDDDDLFDSPVLKPITPVPLTIPAIPTLTPASVAPVTQPQTEKKRSRRETKHIQQQSNNNELFDEVSSTTNPTLAGPIQPAPIQAASIPTQSAPLATPAKNKEKTQNQTPKTPAPKDGNSVQQTPMPKSQPTPASKQQSSQPQQTPASKQQSSQPQQTPAPHNNKQSAQDRRKRRHSQVDAQGDDNDDEIDDGRGHVQQQQKQENQQQAQKSTSAIAPTPLKQQKPVAPSQQQLRAPQVTPAKQQGANTPAKSLFPKKTTTISATTITPLSTTITPLPSTTATAGTMLPSATAAVTQGNNAANSSSNADGNGNELLRSVKRRKNKQGQDNTIVQLPPPTPLGQKQ